MTIEKGVKPREFHAASWGEELIFEQSVPGERGVLVPEPEEGVDSMEGTVALGGLARKIAPCLPELNQMKVNRHYLRLSQEIQDAVDVAINVSEGTCTMKYSPKVQEHASRMPEVNDVHPLQDPSTLQGILEVVKKTGDYLKQISGMEHFSLQPAAGGQAMFTAGSIMRAYHRDNCHPEKTEIITTSFSHPVNGAAPKSSGFFIVTLPPDKDGLPDLEALKAAVNEKTAGIFITNPEDTGIYNPRIREYVDAVHEVGGLCFYDQANANGLLGIARAREAGFDMCHFNLHKTFSAPHGSYGPGGGAIGVREFLAPYLPEPRIVFEGGQYSLSTGSLQSIGRVKMFMGNIGVILKAYMWIRQLGAEGLKEAAKVAVLNNNYVKHYLEQVKGITMFYGEGATRLEQVRYSWDQMQKDTGIGNAGPYCRLLDFAIPDFWMSHPPELVPEPMTIEPCECYSKADLDEFIAAIREVAREAYEEPEIYEQYPPFNSAAQVTPIMTVEELKDLGVSWRMFQKNIRPLMEQTE